MLTVLRFIPNDKWNKHVVHHVIHHWQCSDKMKTYERLYPNLEWWQAYSILPGHENERINK